jgi:hypothetical protein
MTTPVQAFTPTRTRRSTGLLRWLLSGEAYGRWYSPLGQAYKKGVPKPAARRHARESTEWAPRLNKATAVVAEPAPNTWTWDKGNSARQIEIASARNVSPDPLKPFARL